MIGLVVVTHAGLAGALVKAASMICGDLERCEAVELHPDAPPGQLLQRISDAIARVGGEPVMIMTDMFGGTPSNTGISFIKEGEVEVLSGVNLPMIIEFFSRRERMSLDELAASLKRSGRESIIVAGEFLKQ